MKEYKIKTASGMRKLGWKIASVCNSNSIFALHGSLGAGKSEFVRGFISFFDDTQNVISPTFTYVQEYDASASRIYHFDLYRLSSIEEFMLIGGMEVLSYNSVKILIEWPEMIEEILDKDRLVNVNITVNDDNTRLVGIDGTEI